MTPEPLPAKAASVPLGRLLPNPKMRLQDQFHEVARFKHLSPRTEAAYWDWSSFSRCARSGLHVPPITLWSA
jgi:hypothetical protein